MCSKENQKSCENDMCINRQRKREEEKKKYLDIRGRRLR